MNWGSIDENIANIPQTAAKMIRTQDPSVESLAYYRVATTFQK